MPEGYEFISDDPLMKEFVDILNDKEVTKENLGPKLASLYVKASEANVQRWLDVQQEWVKELENDPQLGGDKLEPALKQIDQLILDFASSRGDKAKEADEALRGAFDTTGAGNNPEILRFLNWIATQQGEGAPLSGGSTSGERSRAERMYGT